MARITYKNLIKLKKITLNLSEILSVFFRMKMTFKHFNSMSKAIEENLIVYFLIILIYFNFIFLHCFASLSTIPFHHLYNFLIAFTLYFLFSHWLFLSIWPYFWVLLLHFSLDFILKLVAVLIKNMLKKDNVFQNAFSLPFTGVFKDFTLFCIFMYI